MFWHDNMRQQQRDEADRQFREHLREQRKQEQIDRLKHEPKRHDRVRDRWGQVR